MRQFVVVGHEAPTRPEFSLDDLPGAGRMDALCRCVTAAVLLSHDIRENVRVHLVLGDQYTVVFEAADLRHLHPDERSTAALVRNALESRGEAVGRMAVETSPGVSLVRLDLEAVLAEIDGQGTVVELHAEGTPAVEVEPPSNPVFVLSDHRDFTEEEREQIVTAAGRRVSLGPRRLHGDQAITVAHAWLDTDGFRSW